MGALAEDSPQPVRGWGELRGRLGHLPPQSRCAALGSDGDFPQPHTGWGELGGLALASPKPRTGLRELGGGLGRALASPEPVRGSGE